MKKTEDSVKILTWGLGIAVILVIIFAVINSGKLVIKNSISYKKNNIVHNTTSYSYYDDIIHVGLNKLGIEETVVIVQEVSTIPNSNFGDLELKAVIRNSGNQYLILVNNLGRLEAIKVLSHELIHLKQYKSGRLIEKGGIITFEGKEYYKNELPNYYARPWEKEAFMQQMDLREEIAKEILE